MIADFDDLANLHEYSALSSSPNNTWIVDTGASYDVVSVGMAETMSWERVPLKDAVGINTANGLIYATHAVVSPAPGMPERVYAAEMQDSPSRISVGNGACTMDTPLFGWRGRTHTSSRQTHLWFAVRCGVGYHIFRNA